MSFIYQRSGRTTLSLLRSRQDGQSPDGSIALCVGPTARQARKTTGSRPVANATLPAMRFLWPDRPELNHKTFKLADFERA